MNGAKLIRAFLQRPSALPKQSVLEEKGAKLFEQPPKTFFSAYKVPIGIEVEVEGFVPNLWPRTTYWRVDKDGSLKDHGAELISVPVAGKNIDYALAELERAMKTQSPRWTHRCSVHVHINVQSWSVNKVQELVRAYAVFEDLFFYLVPAERKGGSFCYPLRDCPPDQIPVPARDGKYCALNVSSSVQEHGTVEFRHMQGTANALALRRWIQLIVKLHAYVRKHSAEDLRARIFGLNTNSEYHQFVVEVFGPTAILFPHNILQQAMEEGVLWAKTYYPVQE